MPYALCPMPYEELIQNGRMPFDNQSYLMLGSAEDRLESH